MGCTDPWGTLIISHTHTIYHLDYLHRRMEIVPSMSRKNIRRSLVLLFLLLQTFAIVTSAIPLTNPVSLFNSTTKHPASTSNQELNLHNVTSPSNVADVIDYRIVGTPLVLRFTETGRPFARTDVQAVIDAAIRTVVEQINAGHGNDHIKYGRFFGVSKEIDLRIWELQDADLTYFLLGKQYPSLSMPEAPRPT